MSNWFIITIVGLVLTVGALSNILLKHKTPASLPITVKTTIKHLGIIMDGNRRWARAHNVSFISAYKRGLDALNLTADYCIAHGISILSVYAFSLENFQRDPQEIQGVFEQFAKEAHTALPDLIKRKIALRFIGDPQAIPQHLAPILKDLEMQTAQGTALALNILFCYGGRQEINAAVKKIVQECKEGILKEVPSEEAFKKYLWTNDIPDPELVIRTGGCKRLSNFMPYQTIYSEFHFIDHLWPDFTIEDLNKALQEYEQRARTTFGK